ncbi:MAG: hypothetical protein QOD99_879 [Chthoniobacter sp.]|nr:hypothetical protein [Chthoniobacter sp.]
MIQPDRFANETDHLPIPSNQFAIHEDRFQIGRDSLAIHAERFLIQSDLFSIRRECFQSLRRGRLSKYDFIGCEAPLNSAAQAVIGRLDPLTPC